MVEGKIVIVVSGILQDNKGRILLLKRSSINSSNKDVWQLPEGKMEFGETPKETLTREIKEETTLKTNDLTLIYTFAHPMRVKGNRYHVVRIIFKASWQGDITLSEDHTRYAWFPLNQTKKLRLIAGTKRILSLI